MLYDYSTQYLETITSDFFNATGVNLSILDSNFGRLIYNDIPVSNEYCNCIQCNPKGKKRCFESDLTLLKKCKQTGRAVHHTCHAGLVDIAVPISHNNFILGFIILGQIKNEIDFDPSVSLGDFEKTEQQTLKTLYDNLPLFDNKKINSVINLATILAKHILIDGIIKPQKLSTLETAVNFIELNLDKELTVSYICENTFISVSVLYNLFRKHFNCTISEYINKKRVEKAIELLLNTDDSIKHIANCVGFSDPTYFSKMFKKIIGMRPVQYRKNRTKVKPFLPSSDAVLLSLPKES